MNFFQFLISKRSPPFDTLHTRQNRETNANAFSASQPFDMTFDIIFTHTRTLTQTVTQIALCSIGLIYAIHFFTTSQSIIISLLFPAPTEKNVPIKWCGKKEAKEKATTEI